MEAVNLLPAYARPGSRWTTVGRDLQPRRVLAGAGAVAGVAVLALAAAFVHERSIVSDRQDSLAQVQTQLAVVQAKAEPLKAAQTTSETKLGSIRAISAQRIPWQNVLRDLARVLPDKVYLQTLQIQSQTPFAPPSGPGSAATAAPTTTAGTPTAFTVTGAASSQNRVAMVLDRLAALPWLSDVTLQSSTRQSSAAGSKGLDQFTISANFNAAGGAR
jgi:Tfp pilus assembly protein PilN